MSNLREIIGYNRFRRQIMKLSNLVAEFPPLEQIHQITLIDHNRRPYVYKLMRNEPEPAAGLDDAITCDSFSIDLNDIKEIFTIFTDEQRDIVMHIYYVYKNKFNDDPIDSGTNGDGDDDDDDDDNPKIILQGPAGTGKSTIINFIEKLITWEENKTSDAPDKIKVLKCAFTGKAASNIDGVTLNHMFSIPIYKTRSLNQKRLETKKELLDSCIFFICDEISMVGERLMNSVNMRLKEIFANDKLYGNRFVLLVGDLYQIDPVKQKCLYPNSELWTCCEFYELTKIMRQQDETFIQALNNFKNSQMTEDDMKLLRSREIQDIDEVPDSVIHLFYRNNHVDEYNDAKIERSTGAEEMVNTIDGDDWTPSNLRVKVGIRYMITYNLDIGDYLANGTTGIVKGFDYDSDDNVDVVWMEFHSSSVGRKARQEYFRTHEKPDFENYVPIYRSSIVVKLKSDPNSTKKVGNMFPLKAAEAITVHKSQGQTYHDGVCIHFTEDKYDKLRTDKTLQYVALTRVKRLEDLYFTGNLRFSDVNSTKFTRTGKELERLRTEKRLTLAFEKFEDKTGDVIIFLNTGLTFNKHHQFITTDRWYNSGSLLIFTETNTIGSDEIEIPNYEIAFRSDHETVERSGGGIICYKDPCKSVEVISSIADGKNKIYLTLLEYEKCFYIVTGVKGDLSDEDFGCALAKFDRYIQHKKCISFIGNFKLSSTDLKKEMADNVHLKTYTRSVKEEEYDIVYTTKNWNLKRDRFGAYVYIPSPNAPIYVKLPPKAEIMNNFGGNAVDYNRPGTSQQFDSEEMEMD